MKAGVAGVAKVVEDDDRHHEKSISHREDVKGGATEVLGPHIEVKISLWIKTIHISEAQIKNLLSRVVVVFE